MKKLTLKIAILLVGAAVLAPLTTSAAEPSSRVDAGTSQAPRELERDFKVTMKYLLYLPKDYDQKDSWPLLLFLHGAGERGDDLNLVKKHGPPKLIEEGHEFPFIVVSPQCPRNRRWEPFKLAALLDEIVEKHKVDQDRISVTGLRYVVAGRFPTRSVRCSGAHLRRWRADHRQAVQADSGLGVPRGQRHGRSPGTIGKDGGSHETSWWQHQIHRVSRGGPRLVDRELRQPGTVRMAVAAEAGGEVGANR
jgi:hypothetical protein